MCYRYYGSASEALGGGNSETKNPKAMLSDFYFIGNMGKQFGGKASAEVKNTGANIIKPERVMHGRSAEKMLKDVTVNMTADIVFRSLRCVEKLSEILFRSEILTRSLLSKKII